MTGAASGLLGGFYGLGGAVLAAPAALLLTGWRVTRGQRPPDGSFGSLAAIDGPPTGSPHPPGGLRYLSVVADPGGRRIYYEATRADGAHELRAELLP